MLYNRPIFGIERQFQPVFFDSLKHHSLNEPSKKQAPSGFPKAYSNIFKHSFQIQLVYTKYWSGHVGELSGQRTFART